MNNARTGQEQKWERMSTDLLELEVELVNTGNFQNLIDLI